MNRQKYILTALIVSSLVLSGCGRNGSSDMIERRHQFSMAIGKMEDQIDLIQIPGQPFQQSIDIVMRNGLYYISDGAARKVMEFSSYGDLLTLHFNESVNPAPVLLGEDTGDGRTVNRKAFGYPFSELGGIAVTASGMLLVEDALAEDRHIWDEELGTSLRNVILRFDDEGNVIDYVGQEGISGTPFPYIDTISVGLGDVLTVIARTLENWLIFGYDAAGNRMYSYKLSEQSLPGADEALVASLDAVMPAPESDRVFVKTDYYRDNSADADNQEPDYRFYRSTVHWIDTRSGRFSGSLDLPPSLRTSGKAQMFNREEQEVIQYLVGVSEGGYLFFVSPVTEEIYNLLIIDLSGLVIHRGSLRLSDEDILFSRFYVTHDGILTAFIAGDTEVDVVLWRTDRYIGGTK